MIHILLKWRLIILRSLSAICKRLALLLSDLLPRWRRTVRSLRHQHETASWLQAPQLLRLLLMMVSIGRDLRCVQQGRYCEISATIRCDFSFDGYLHLSRLRNYGGHVNVSLFSVQILLKKMATSKINSNLKKWLFQVGWIIINAIWLFSVLTSIPV